MTGIQLYRFIFSLLIFRLFISLSKFLIAYDEEKVNIWERPAACSRGIHHLPLSSVLH
jgi:hypothetical protein